MKSAVRESLLQTGLTEAEANSEAEEIAGWIENWTADRELLFPVGGQIPDSEGGGWEKK